MRNLLCCILSLLAFQCYGVTSYRILMTFTIPSPSHHIIGKALMQGLIADGHEVTLISPFKENYAHENFTEIHLDGIIENGKCSME